jgi:4'-phosphopantetheinyl transferase
MEVSAAQHSFLKTRWAFNASEWKPTTEEFEKLVNELVPEEEERKRIGRYRFEKDRIASLIGRLLIRKLLQHVRRGLVASASASSFYLDTKFNRTPEGKPYLLRTEELEGFSTLPLRWNFNISHHGDWVVIASDPERIIGVDVSKVEVFGANKACNSISFSSSPLLLLSYASFFSFLVLFNRM